MYVGHVIIVQIYKNLISQWLTWFWKNKKIYYLVIVLVFSNYNLTHFTVHNFCGFVLYSLYRNQKVTFAELRFNLVILITVLAFYCPSFVCCLIIVQNHWDSNAYLPNSYRTHLDNHSAANVLDDFYGVALILNHRMLFVNSSTIRTTIKEKHSNFISRSTHKKRTGLM